MTVFRVSSSFLLLMTSPGGGVVTCARQDTALVEGQSELLRGITGQTAVHLELVEVEDPRASNCPAGQRLLRVAGGRDQVG